MAKMSQRKRIVLALLLLALVLLDLATSLPEEEGGKTRDRVDRYATTLEHSTVHAQYHHDAKKNPTSGSRRILISRF